MENLEIGWSDECNAIEHVVAVSMGALLHLFQFMPIYAKHNISLHFSSSYDQNSTRKQQLCRWLLAIFR